MVEKEKAKYIISAAEYTSGKECNDPFVLYNQWVASRGIGIPDPAFAAWMINLIHYFLLAPHRLLEESIALDTEEFSS